MRKSIHSRGFTLLELLVGAAVGALVLVGISLTFVSQAKQYQAHASRRALQANARQAMSFMERRLRDAGYGVNADRAIIPYDGFNAANPAANASQPGFPDAFIVHWRDPRFRLQATAANAAQITLAANELKTDLRMGTILLVICAPTVSANQINERIVNNKPPHAFVTVGQYVPAGAIIIPLDQTDPASAPNSPVAMPGRLFHEQAAELTNACFTSVTAPPVVVMINRAAFYVARFNDGQGLRTPYLMMHSGQDLPDASNPQGDQVINEADAVPVAVGIEQLQVSYILDTNAEDLPTSNPPGDATPIVRGVEDDMDGDHYGERWEEIVTPGFGRLPRNWFLNPYTNWPNTLYDPLTNALPLRQLADHPANIRQVRLTLISRSTVPDLDIPGDNLLVRQNGTPFPDGPALPGANGRSWRHLENLGAPNADFRPDSRGFHRFILRQSVAPKNMTVNRQFVPVNPLGGG